MSCSIFKVQIMCNVSQGVLEKGIKQGVDIGEEKTTLKLIRNLMESMGQTVEQAMAVLRIPADEQEKYKALLRN